MCLGYVDTALENLGQNLAPWGCTHVTEGRIKLSIVVCAQGPFTSPQPLLFPCTLGTQTILKMTRKRSDHDPILPLVAPALCPHRQGRGLHTALLQV